MNVAREMSKALMRKSGCSQSKEVAGSGCEEDCEIKMTYPARELCDLCNIVKRFMMVKVP
jgi:hypothetical protein